MLGIPPGRDRRTDGQTDGQTDRIPIANTRSQQYLPVQLSRVKIGLGSIRVPAWNKQYLRLHAPCCESYQSAYAYNNIITSYMPIITSDDEVVFLGLSIYMQDNSKVMNEF